MPRKRKPLADRFWTKVNKTEGCWLWIGAKNLQGYGHMSNEDGSHIQAHRASWVIHNGTIPEGKHLCHSCDVALCVRPDHLFLGTNNDNRQDSVRKKRYAHGERSGHAKLTEGQVLEARHLFSLPGHPSQASYARQLGIHPTSFNDILAGRTWRHLIDASKKAN